MKKGMLLLGVMGVVLACSAPVFAWAEKTVFRPEPWTATVEGGINASATGYVIVQTTKEGGAEVSVRLSKAAKLYTYVVKSNGKVLGTFTTDEKGSGGLQFYVADPSTTLGRWINIWQTAGLDSSSWDTYGLLYGQRY